MILIQVILIAGFLIFLWRFLASPNSYQSRALTKIFAVLFTLVAVIVIIFPNISSDVAHFVGVGQGTDLILYMLTLAFIFAVLNMYIRNKNEHKRIVALSRKVAILEANSRYAKNK